MSNLTPLPTLDPVDHEDNPSQMALQWNQVYPILQQNMAVLSQGPRRTPGPAQGSLSQAMVGSGVALNALTGRMLLLACSGLKVGLSLANGSDRGKVNITYNFVGVGQTVAGDGTSTTLTADVTVSGAGGLDTGTEAANTWYAVFVIAGPTNTTVYDATTNNYQPPIYREGPRVSSLLSTSGTAPTLPNGFSWFRRVGWVRNNGSSDFYRFYNTGDWIWWNEDITGADFTQNGLTATTFTQITSFNKVIPSTSTLVHARSQVAKTVAGGLTFLNVKPHGSNLTDSTGTRVQLNSNQVSGGGDGASWVVPTDTSQSFDYIVGTSNSGTICVDGYYDPV